MALRFLGIAMIALAASAASSAQNSAPAAPSSIASDGDRPDHPDRGHSLPARRRRPHDGAGAAVGDGPLPLPDRHRRGPHRNLDRACKPHELCARPGRLAAQHRGRVADHHRGGSQPAADAQGSPQHPRAAAERRLHGRRRNPRDRFAAFPAGAVRLRGEHPVDRPVRGPGFPRRAGNDCRPGHPPQRPAGGDRGDRQRQQGDRGHRYRVAGDHRQ